MVGQPGGEVRGPRRLVRAGRDARRVQRLDLACVQQRPVGLHAVVERLHPEPIPGREKRPGPLVPDGEGEHPDQPVQAGIAPPEIRGQHDLGVGAAGVRVVGQFRPKLDVVVDLAVEVDPHGTVGRGHRSVPGGRQVDDREPVVAEPDRALGVDVDAGVVRAPMAERRDHGVQPAPLQRLPRPRDPGDAAHQAWLPWGAACRSSMMASITFRSRSSSTLTERSVGITYGRITSPQMEPRSISTSRRVR